MRQQSFRLLKKIKDPKFEIDRLEFYSLSLFIGPRDFQILVSDTETNQCMLLEDYVFETDISENERIETLRFIFDDHHLLLANFWSSINLIIKNRSYSFVPEPYFKEEKAATYLNVNASFDSAESEIMLSYHKLLDFVNVFSVPKPIVQLVSDIYPGKKVKFIHQSSSLINGVAALKSNREKKIATYVDRFGLHVVVVQNNRLLFYNQYLIKKFEDYMKFIKMAASELQFDPQLEPILLFGFLGKHTPHFSKLQSEMNQLETGNRPRTLKYGYVFDELLEHQYFDLFSTESLVI